MLAPTPEVIEWANKVPEMFNYKNEVLDVEWNVLDIQDTSSLPSVQSIYFISSENNILYIGKTTNLFQRFANGHHKAIQFMQFFEPDICWIELPGVDRNTLSKFETYYINKHKPKCNDT